jgi:hypothetical protein
MQIDLGILLASACAASVLAFSCCVKKRKLQKTVVKKYD